MIEASWLAPETVIVSTIQDVPGLLVGIADQLNAGTLKGNATSGFGFKEHRRYLGKWGDSVPQGVRDQETRAVNDYLDGKPDRGVKKPVVRESEASDRFDAFDPAPGRAIGDRDGAPRSAVTVSVAFFPLAWTVGRT